jgi:hypothetical protein
VKVIAIFMPSKEAYFFNLSVKIALYGLPKKVILPESGKLL